VVPPSAVLVSFPGAYSASDPGINFNIDSSSAMTSTSYVVPGPAVWDGTGNAPTTPDPVPTTMVTSVAPVATPTPTVPSCTPIQKYGQCGGKEYKGCTICASGSTCSASGDFYSQCV
jgi:hypothetical protein